MVVTAPYRPSTVVRSNEQYDWALPAQQRDTSSYYADLIESYQALVEKCLEPVVDSSTRFDLLVEQWHKERGAASSLSDIIACPSYHKIMAMGRDEAVGLILKRMRAEGDDPDHWFWALHILTDANPVSDQDQGILRNMAKAWLDWASNEGYAF